MRSRSPVPTTLEGVSSGASDERKRTVGDAFTHLRGRGFFLGQLTHLHCDGIGIRVVYGVLVDAQRLGKHCTLYGEFAIRVALDAIQKGLFNAALM